MLKHLINIGLAFGAGYLLTFFGLNDYMIFHVCVELFSIIVSVSVFLLAWNARFMMKNRFFLLLGFGFLFIALFDFIHTLAYQGMSLLPVTGANMATELWIASRLLLAVIQVVAPFFLKRQFNTAVMVVVLSVVSLGLLLSIIWWDIFPDSFETGVGLTPFKIYTEYVIIGLFIVAGLYLTKRQHLLHPRVFSFLILAICYNMVSELLFTLYSTPFDVFNRAGHIFKLFATVYIYRAIIQYGLRQPYDLMFRELKQVNDRKDEFIDIAGHELKTPLTSLKMYAQLLEHQAAIHQDKKLMKLVERINFQTNRISSLTNELLDVSKIETGKLSINKSKFNLHEELVKLVHDFENVSNNHQLKFIGQAPAVFYGDKERLIQAVSNLITNAIKYSPDSDQVVVSAATGQNRFKLSVKDFGIGIEKSEIPNLFDKYFRAPAAGKNFDGMGLGLYVTNQIIRAHQGDIDIDSDLGKGSTFTIILPIKANLPHRSRRKRDQ